jgi:PAS domain S-box-containing protein
LDLKLIIALSVLAQFAAAVLALRLIPLTGRRRAWTFLALALVLMEGRRVIMLYRLFSGEVPHAVDMPYEAMGLLVSVLVLAGVAGIGPVFRALKSSEEAVRLSERRFRGIVETAHEGIVALDDQGRILFANRRMAEMIGCRIDELIGRSYRDFVDEAERARADELFGRHLQGSREQNDIRLRRRDGSDLWIIVSGSPTLEEGGRRTGALVMVTDISDRKRMEVERETLIKGLREALANVKTLSGLLPICASCKKIRDGRGNWHPLESFISRHSDAEFTHGYCPECLKRIHPGPDA